MGKVRRAAGIAADLLAVDIPTWRRAPARAAAASLIAADAAVAAVALPLWSAAWIGRLGWRAAVTLATPPRPTGWLDDEPDPAERFRLAAARHGQSAADLARVERSLWRRWAVLFMLSALSLAWGIIVSTVWSRLYGLWGALLPLVPMPALVMLAGEAAFHHWQVRRRSLDGLSTFLRDPGGWIPPSSGADGRAQATWAVVAAAALMTLPTGAWAATSTTAQDVALNILQALLPFQNATNGGGIQATAFSSALYVFAAALNGVAVLVLCYQVPVGLINTAREGEVLGKRWDTAWAMISLLFGWGMLVPIASGYSGIHGLVYVVGVESNKIANDTWSVYVSKILGTDAAATTAPGIPPTVGGSVVAEEIARSEICAAVLLARAAVSGATPAVALPDAGGTFVANTASRGKPADGSGLQVWRWGGPCGALSLPVPASSVPAAVSTFSAARIAAVTAVMTAIRSGEQAIGQQAAQWAEGQGGAMGAAAFPSSIQSVFDTLGQTYDQTMLSAAATLSATQNATARQNLTAAAQTGGWMLAFSYDRALGQASQQTATLASEAPDWTKPIVVPDARGLGPGADKEGVKAVGQVLGALDDELAKERGAGQLTAADLSAAGASSDSYITRLLEPLDHRISAAIIDFTAADSNDPVTDMMALGAKFTAAGEATSAAALSASFGACNAAGGAVGACDAFKTAMGFVRPIIWVCFALGFTLQTLLPMLPWLAGLTLSIGWVITTVEIIIAAPIFALLMCRMDAHSLFEHNRVGLVIALNWALRPVIGILGYIGCRTIMPLVMPLLTKYFSVAYLGSQGGHFAGVAGTLGAVLLLSYVTFQTMARLYSMIITIPDRLPRLLGAPGDGADADSHSGGVRGVVAAGGSAGHMAPGAGPGGGGGSPARKPRGGGPGGVRPVGGKGGGAGGAAAGAAAARAADAATAAKMSSGGGGGTYDGPAPGDVNYSGPATAGFSGGEGGDSGGGYYDGDPGPGGESDYGGGGGGYDDYGGGGYDDDYDDGGHGGGGGGYSGGAGPDSWVNQSGGFDGLSPDQQDAAMAAYDKLMSGSRASWGEEMGLDGYVRHVQSKQAESRGD